MNDNSVRQAIERVATQEQMGKLLGVSRVAIYKWCVNNEVPWERLDDFCVITQTHPKLVNETAKKLFNRWK